MEIKRVRRIKITREITHRKYQIRYELEARVPYCRKYKAEEPPTLVKV
jgi:hypothetical protein